MAQLLNLNLRVLLLHILALTHVRGLVSVGIHVPYHATQDHARPAKSRPNYHVIAGSKFNPSDVLILLLDLLKLTYRVQKYAEKNWAVEITLAKTCAILVNVRSVQSRTL